MKKSILMSRLFSKTELSEENFKQYLAYKKERNEQIASLVKTSLGFLTGVGWVVLAFYAANLYLTCMIAIVFGLSVGMGGIIYAKNERIRAASIFIFAVSFCSIGLLAGFYFDSDEPMTMGFIGIGFSIIGYVMNCILR